ncbi:MAG: hypothetical protein OXC07_11950 [Kistimonas sp.]|nr:hypothetical protein [Kistimonas sp.]
MNYRPVIRVKPDMGPEQSAATLLDENAWIRATHPGACKNTKFTGSLIQEELRDLFSEFLITGE